MDGGHFDNLTRAIATSRRRAIRILAGAAAGGFLTLLGETRAAAQQRPRPRGCRRRQDGARCGRCGVCAAGVCVADDALCPGCRTCNPASLRCVPVGEGESCGTCLTCQEGECRAVPDDTPCGPTCGICLNGTCQVDDEQCDGGTNPCVACDAGSFTCVPVREGLPCGGDCGTCLNGVCEPNHGLCDLDCGVCDPISFTCSSYPDGFRCGLGECGACESGQCVPSNEPCDSDCALCALLEGRFSCIPLNDGSSCGGNCGVCQLGICQQDEGRCDPGCEICDPNSLDCVPLPDGTVCRPNAVCQDGACADLLSCEFPLVTCFDIDGFGAPVGPRFCCDTSPGVCQNCFTIPDPSSPEGYLCTERRADGHCLRHPRECRVCHEPCCAGRMRDLATCRCM